MKILKDIPYRPASGSSGLCDLFIPDRAARKNIAVLAIHGGGWSIGTKETWESVALWLCTELKLVAILDADKEGFLRSARLLVQVAGRAARNAEGRVILYADHVTDSMKALIDTTKARREKQIAYNKKHHITPKTILKAERETITDVLGLSSTSSQKTTSWNAEDLRETAAMLREDPAAFKPSRSMRGRKGKVVRAEQPDWDGLSVPELIEALEKEMLSAAENLEYERAAQLRDRIRAIEKNQ